MESRPTTKKRFMFPYSLILHSAASLHFQTKVSCSFAQGHIGRVDIFALRPHKDTLRPHILYLQPNKTLKICVNLSILSVTIHRHHHQHSRCLPAAVADCQKHQSLLQQKPIIAILPFLICVSSSSISPNCFLHLPLCRPPFYTSPSRYSTAICN